MVYKIKETSVHFTRICISSIKHDDSSVSIVVQNQREFFSSINLIKSKQRNELGNEKLAGLLHIKTALDNTTCYEMEIVAITLEG